MKNSVKKVNLDKFAQVQISSAKTKAVKGGANEVIIQEVADIW